MNVSPRSLAPQTRNKSDVKNMTFRGGGLKEGLESFFTPNKKFRTGMFMATSFTESVALSFMKREGSKTGLKPVLWKIKFAGRAAQGHDDTKGQAALLEVELGARMRRGRRVSWVAIHVKSFQGRVNSRPRR